jgi:transcriptional regulator with XRE-family HTH domain
MALAQATQANVSPNGPLVGHAATFASAEWPQTGTGAKLPRKFRYSGPERLGPKRDMKPFAEALVEARVGARLQMQDLVTRSGVGRRTLLRWECALTRPRPGQLERVLEALRHYAPASAAKVARAAGVTLRDAEIELPAAAPPTEVARGDALSLSSVHVLDSIVCATADAADIKPEQARRALRAALARMKQIGVTLDGLAAMFEAHDAPGAVSIA